MMAVDRPALPSGAVWEEISAVLVMHPWLRSLPVAVYIA